MDPYTYPNTSILINKLDIRDEQELIEVEAQLLIAGILDITSLAEQIDFQKFESLRLIHHYLFHDLYSWAGEFRTVNIYKSEKVLNGLSVIYTDKDEIEAVLELIFRWTNRVEWSYSNSLLVEDFSNFMTKIWRVHPYREGNTRTVSVFMKLFAESKGLNFNDQLLSINASYLRNALVLAAVEESPEPKYLEKIISDALYVVPSQKVDLDEEVSSSYQVIDQYDVSEYEEKPFDIKFNNNNTEK